MPNGLMIVILTGVLLVASISTSCAAEPYVGVAVGLSFFHDSDVKSPSLPTATMSYDTGNCFNISGGYYLDGGRIEGEFGFKVANPKALSVNGKSIILRDAEVDVTTLSYMINAYYDVKTESALLPYVGAGFGVISAHFKNVETIKTDTVLGTQLIAGLGYKLDSDVTLDISYHYQVADFDLKINGKTQSYDSSSVLFGARMIF